MAAIDDRAFGRSFQKSPYGPASPATNRQLQREHPICRQSSEPSVGLEPTTPSLPWKDGGVSSVHGRSLAGTKCLQIARSRVNGRGGRNPAEVKLVDGMWTENQ